MLLWLFPACQQPPPVMEAKDIFGCYSVHFLEWPVRSEHLPGPDNFARTIELSSDTLFWPSEEKLYAIRIVNGALRSPDSTPTSWSINDGVVRIRDEMVFSGMSITASANPDSLHGTAISFTDGVTDDPPSFLQGKATLLRMNCPAS